MPTFSKCCPGADEYICQVCARIKCGRCQPPQWRPDLTGRKSAGNICPTCREEKETPISLFDHCKKESGLSSPQEINRYMNRHYGHA